MMISVFTSTYNCRYIIEELYRSLQCQTFKDFEWIIVDDGNLDNCGRICDAYAQRDSRVHVIHQENGGLSAAQNADIDWTFTNSDSQWLTFIDSDDGIHLEYLSALYNAVVNTNLPLSICRFIRTSGEEPVINPTLLQFQPWSSEHFFVEHNVNSIIACGKLYKKNLFSSIRYPLGKLHKDEFTTYRLMLSTKKVAIIDAPLYYYFQNSSGITGYTWSTR